MMADLKVQKGFNGTGNYMQNLAAEYAILAAMMHSVSAVNDAGQVLNTSDFSTFTTQYLYQAVVNLTNRRIPVDVLNIEDELRRYGVTMQISRANIEEVYYYKDGSAEIKNKIAIVRQCSILRELNSIASDIVQQTLQETANPEEILVNAEKKLASINCMKDNDGLKVGDTIDSVMLHIEDVVMNAKPSGLLCGWQDLDKQTNGFPVANMTILAGRPGMGKSALAANIATNIALFGKTVAYFSLEMTRQMLIERMIQAETGVSLRVLQSKQVSMGAKQEKLDYIRQRLGKLKQAEFYIYDSGGMTTVQFQSACRRMAATKKVDFIVVDYLQLLRVPGMETSENENIITSKISAVITDLAKELNVPILALSQLNRGVEARQIKKPVMSDLRNSGTLEQDAALIMMLYRDDYYKDADKERDFITEVNICKNRFGDTGVVELKWNPAITRFDSIGVDFPV